MIAVYDKLIYFNEASSSVWNANNVYPSVTAPQKYLHLSDSSNKNNGITRNINWSGNTGLTVSFEAKVNNYTGGPVGAGTSNDCNSLGMQLLINNKRFCLSLEKSVVRATSGTTWGASFNYPEGISSTEWHQYILRIMEQHGS